MVRMTGEGFEGVDQSQEQYLQPPLPGMMPIAMDRSGNLVPGVEVSIYYHAGQEGSPKVSPYARPCRPAGTSNEEFIRALPEHLRRTIVVPASGADFYEGWGLVHHPEEPTNQ